jgi:hypothetical protein
VLEIWDLNEFIFKKPVDKINPYFVNYLRDTILEAFQKK